MLAVGTGTRVERTRVFVNLTVDVNTLPSEVIVFCEVEMMVLVVNATSVKDAWASRTALACLEPLEMSQID